MWKIFTLPPEASDGLLDKGGVYFRGLSLRALELSLSLFVPVIHSNAMTNEFRLGIYITKVFATAKDYAGLSGAIMVFKYPDLHNLTVWEPNEDEWKLLTAHWLSLPVSNPFVPEGHKGSDVIRGAISVAINGSRTCGYLEKIPSWRL